MFKQRSRSAATAVVSGTATLPDVANASSNDTVAGENPPRKATEQPQGIPCSSSTLCQASTRSNSSP